MVSEIAAAAAGAAGGTAAGRGRGAAVGGGVPEAGAGVAGGPAAAAGPAPTSMALSALVRAPPARVTSSRTVRRPATGKLVSGAAPVASSNAPSPSRSQASPVMAGPPAGDEAVERSATRSPARGAAGENEKPSCGTRARIQACSPGSSRRV